MTPHETEGAPPAAAGAAPRRRLRPRQVALRIALAIVVGVVLLEGSLRFLLFSDALAKTRVAARLRRPELYSAAECRDYWKLEVLFSTLPRRARPHRQLDERVGWRKRDLDPATLAHVDEAKLAGRRPVLLFGDSYAQCVSSVNACWQDLLERSELAESLALLNYGVGGYGLDQMLLLARAVLDRFEAADPIVVIALLVDDDLDRPWLPLRNNPKPWFSLADGELVLHPMEETDSVSWVHAHPPRIPSYLARLLLFGSGWLRSSTAIRFTPDRGHEAGKKALDERLLDSLTAELRERELRFFFLLLHGQGALVAPGPSGWQEPFLYDYFQMRGLPFVSSKRWLLSRARVTGAKLDSFYIADGPGKNHYNDEGNAVAFEALLQGLLGHFEPYEYLAPE